MPKKSRQEPHEELKKTFNPESLVTLAARTASPHLTPTLAGTLPEEVWPILRRFMSKKRQVEVFRNYEFFYEDGQLRVCGECNEKGQLHGVSTSYQGEGRIMEHKHCKKGLLHGSFQRYSSSGKIKEECMWRDGWRHGLERRYKKKGDAVLPSKDAYWYDGVVIMEVYYDRDWYGDSDDRTQCLYVATCSDIFTLPIKESERQLDQSPWGTEESLRAWKYLIRDWDETPQFPPRHDLCDWHEIPKFPHPVDQFGCFYPLHCPCLERERMKGRLSSKETQD
jgi:hypothetical protein